MLDGAHPTPEGGVSGRVWLQRALELNHWASLPPTELVERVETFAEVAGRLARELEGDEGSAAEAARWYQAAADAAMADGRMERALYFSEKADAVQ